MWGGGRGCIAIFISTSQFFYKVKTPFKKTKCEKKSYPSTHYYFTDFAVV